MHIIILQTQQTVSIQLLLIIVAMEINTIYWWTDIWLANENFQSRLIAVIYSKPFGTCGHIWCNYAKKTLIIRAQNVLYATKLSTSIWFTKSMNNLMHPIESTYLKWNATTHDFPNKALNVGSTQLSHWMKIKFQYFKW